MIKSIVGFTLFSNQISDKSKKSAIDPQCRLLSHFKELNRRTINIGKARLELWGRGDFSDYIHYLPDGTLLILIGLLSTQFLWSDIETKLTRVKNVQDFEFPFYGRFNFLKISSDGNLCTMWNDWCGSIPVYHTYVESGYVISTLEPVVFSAAGFTPDNLHLPGLITLLTHGHYLGEWTLFEGMKTVPADCVAEWEGQSYKWQRIWSVKPSEERWNKGWQELADENYELSNYAIGNVLKSQPTWVLPLSGGLDSRLLAAVGCEMGVNLYAYTYNPSGSDAIYAPQVAKALGLPWKAIDLGSDYLAKYTQIWSDLFGSALHFHGMYQFAFLNALKTELNRPMATGFLGEAISGGHLEALIASRAGGYPYQFLPNEWLHWRIDEVKSLLKVSIDEALEQIADEIESQINSVPGAWFQKLMFLDFWNRQRLFISYQSTVYDYGLGVVTPFLNRDYAQFCLSLPRAVLEKRRLQGEMFKRYFPNLAEIPGTYGTDPLILKGGYLLKRHLARQLPRLLRLGSLGEFNNMPTIREQKCVQTSGRAAFWPVWDAQKKLEEWLDLTQIEESYQNALNGSFQAIKKLKSIQTLAYRL